MYRSYKFKPKARLYDKRKNCGGAPPQHRRELGDLHSGYPARRACTPLLYDGAFPCSNLHARTDHRQAMTGHPRLAPLSIEGNDEIQGIPVELLGKWRAVSRCRHWIPRVFIRVLFYSSVDRGLVARMYRVQMCYKNER